jgi:hypothetical protein
MLALAMQGELEPPSPHYYDSNFSERLIVQNGRFTLTQDEPSQFSVLAMHGTYGNRILTRRFDLIMEPGTEGASVLFLDVREHGASGGFERPEQWEAPSVPHAFGVGFDASNPKNDDPFRGPGNIYGRPEHEVSLHWNGWELHKKTTQVDFKSGEPVPVELTIEFVTGGAEVDLALGGVQEYEDFFIPGMMPYAGRWAFGAENRENGGAVQIANLSQVVEYDAPEPEAPVKVVAFDQVLNNAGRHRNESTVQFPDDNERFGRIVMNLKLEDTPAGVDPWDRLAHIYLLDGDERYEIQRYITPYGGGWQWSVDVTHFRPLLQGEKVMEQVCETYAEGWLVSVSFDFYPGDKQRQARQVVPLWQGRAIMGDPDRPVEEFYSPQTVPVPDWATDAEVITVVTGHGMSPNSNNAAEFMPITRWLTVNGERHENRLWKTDNYLNPCRPQGGTWKYDRAGWAPGDVVAPWRVPVGDLLDAEELKIEYELEPYVNENRGETWDPFHATESYVIFYE